MVENKNKKEKIMTNKEFLERASKMQREFSELYGTDSMGLAGVSDDHIHITAEKFHELERENLLEHISKVLNKAKTQWDYEAMTPQGVKVFALEYPHEVEEK